MIDFVSVFPHCIVGSAWIEVGFSVGVSRVCGLIPIPENMVHTEQTMVPITATLIEPVPGVSFTRDMAELNITDNEGTYVCKFPIDKCAHHLPHMLRKVYASHHGNPVEKPFFNVPYNIMTDNLIHEVA